MVDLVVNNIDVIRQFFIVDFFCFFVVIRQFFIVDFFLFLRCDSSVFS